MAPPLSSACDTSDNREHEHPRAGNHPRWEDHRDTGTHGCGIADVMSPAERRHENQSGRHRPPDRRVRQRVIGDIGHRARGREAVACLDEIVDDTKIPDHHHHGHREPCRRGEHHVDLTKRSRCRPEEDADRRGCHEWCRGAPEMFSGVAANVVARREARLSGNTDGDERRHGPPVAQPSHEPLATCRFVRYFDGCHSPTDDQTSIVGDVAIAMAEVIERRSADGSSANDEIDVTSPEPGCSIASSPLPSSNSAAAPPSGRRGTPMDAGDLIRQCIEQRGQRRLRVGQIRALQLEGRTDRHRDGRRRRLLDGTSITTVDQQQRNAEHPAQATGRRARLPPPPQHLGPTPARQGQSTPVRRVSGRWSQRPSVDGDPSVTRRQRSSTRGRLLLFDLPRLALVSVDDDLEHPPDSARSRHGHCWAGSSGGASALPEGHLATAGTGDHGLGDARVPGRGSEHRGRLHDARHREWKVRGCRTGRSSGLPWFSRCGGVPPMPALPQSP